MTRCAVNYQDGVSQGTGVVKFTTRESAKSACNDLGGNCVHGKNLILRDMQEEKRQERMNARNNRNNNNVNNVNNNNNMMNNN